MSLKTVEWKNNSVVMIDQTKLPNILEYVTYTDFNQVADAIRTLVIRGLQKNIMFLPYDLIRRN